jgi:hypothetical protein
MQIDTHNRDYDINNDTVGFVPSFLPSTSVNNMTQKGGLSPLIECPCVVVLIASGPRCLVAAALLSSQ